jgi:hypothetical protein
VNAIALGWRVLSSTRTTAVLALVFSLAAFVAAAVPQGKEALAIARDAAASDLHRLAAWGLTSVFTSPWFYAVAALLAGNLTAIGLARGFSAPRGKISPEAPPSAALSRELTAAEPENAVEIVRSVLGSRLGAPRAEKVAGARVSMVFDPGGNEEAGTLAAHLGLMLLVLGAGLYAASSADEKGVPHAKLEITDSRTKTTGHFDMVAGEPFELFQYPARYILRDYLASREGLGPAVRIERTASQGPPSDFWVYAQAPAGFDRRHRHDDVEIQAVWLGLSPLPGRGQAASPLGVLMAIGLALIVFGALRSQTSAGRVWVDLEGDRVRLQGQPYLPGDEGFAAAFERWALLTQAALGAR